jgi:hypothetical protein
MAAAATARQAPARAAPRRALATSRPKLRRRPRNGSRASTASRAHHARGAGVMRPAVAGAALLPQAAVRSAGAVRDISDSSLIMRLTRGRGWIAVLGTLLVGIVALNVLSLSLNAGAGATSLQIDELKTQVSSLRAQIDERLSASRVQAEATRLGLAVPSPRAITYLSASDGDAQRLARLLATDSFLITPSQPSSYPAPGTSYAPVSTSAPPTTTTTTTTPSSPAPTSTTPSSGSGSATGASTGSGSATGSTSGSTGGVGL